MSKLAAALGALVLLAGTFIVYLNNEVLDPAAAGDRASKELADDADLRAAIAPKVEDVVPDPIQDLPLVGGASSSAVEVALAQPVAADAFGNAVSAAVEDLTQDDRPHPIVLNLSDVASGVSSSPLDIVTGQVDTLQVDLSGADGLLDLLAFVHGLEPLGIPLLVGGILLLLSSVMLAGRPGDGVLVAGVSVAVAALLGVATLIVGRTLLAGSFDGAETRDAVVATWDALGGDLMKLCVVIAIVGFLAAIAAWLAMRVRGRTAAAGHPRRSMTPAADERFQATERHERPPRPAPDERFQPTERHERPPRSEPDERFQATEIHDRPDRPPPPQEPPPESAEAPDRTRPTERAVRPPPPPPPPRGG